MSLLRPLAWALAALLLAPAALPVAAATHCASLPSDEEVECWKGEAMGGLPPGGEDAVNLVVGLVLGAPFLVAGLVLDVAFFVLDNVNPGPALCFVAEEPPANWGDTCFDKLAQELPN